MKQKDPFYSRPDWMKLRLAVLRRDDWVCNECGVRCLGKKKGSPSPAVDHKKPRKEFPELAMDMGNLQTLCVSCHSRKTIRETFDNAPPKIGYDGFIINE